MSDPAANSQEPAAAIPESLADTPGAALRKLRESRGIAISEVVQAIKFSPRQVEALEAGDHGALPGAVFIRGMVRSYARFLNVDAGPLLALLDVSVPATPPEVRPPDNMGIATSPSGARQIPVLVALSILLLVGAATIVVWNYLAPNTNWHGVEHMTSEPRPPIANETAEPASVNAGNTATAAGASTPVGETSAVLEPGYGRLMFEFHGTSWLEVKDASERTVLTGKFLAGMRQAVVGKPPFQLVVGNAAEVSVQFGDQPVDLKPYTRAEVARLTVQ